MQKPRALRIGYTIPNTNIHARLLALDHVTFCRNQLQARRFQQNKLQIYFQYDPNRAAILNSVRLSPKQHDVPQTIPLLFKIRMSTRATQNLNQLKNALTVFPDNHPNRTFGDHALRETFQNKQRPIICFRNSKSIGSRLISAKIPSIKPSGSQNMAVPLKNHDLSEYAQCYFQARSVFHT